jgi:hypothetical protein
MEKCDASSEFLLTLRTKLIWVSFAAVSMRVGASTADSAFRAPFLRKAHAGNSGMGFLVARWHTLRQESL